LNDILKQRLVGALILLALGVVFWPIIFVQPPEKATGPQQTIPSRPSVSTVAVEAPDSAGVRASPEISVQEEEEVPQVPVAVEIPTEEPEEEAADAEQEPDVIRSRSPEQLAIDSDGVPVAWILQVASVSSAHKAEEMRRRLIDMELKPDVKPLHSGGKTLYRVYLGPKFERAKLEALQAKIDKEFGVTSMVARYIP
jgi:DedD protein